MVESPLHNVNFPSTYLCSTPHTIINTKLTPWPQSANELYRPLLVSEVSANFFADRGCHVVSVTNPYGRNFRFLDRSSYYFFQVAPQLYSRGWVDPVPDPLLFVSCSAGESNPGLPDL
jgi:hypothetical protein